MKTSDRSLYVPLAGHESPQSQLDPIAAFINACYRCLETDLTSSQIPLHFESYICLKREATYKYIQISFMPNEAKEPTICDVIRPCPGIGALHLLVCIPLVISVHTTFEVIRSWTFSCYILLTQHLP